MPSDSCDDTSEHVTFFGKIAAFIKTDPSYAFFCSFVFTSMLSQPLARVFLVASLIALICSKESRKRFHFSSPAVGWLTYFAIAVVITCAMAVVNSSWGVQHHLISAVDGDIESAKGCGKLTKLLWYLAIPLSVANLNTPKRFRTSLLLLIAGGACLAAIVIFIHPVIAWLQVNFHSGIKAVDKMLNSTVWKDFGGRPPSYHYAFISLSSMHNAQHLMVALVAAVSLLLCDFEFLDRGRRRKGAVITAAIAVALVLTCKRGPLFIGVLVSIVPLFLYVRWWKALLVVASMVALAFALPNSRARIMDLPSELNEYRTLVPAGKGHKDILVGGRRLMWNKVVPAVHKEHPYGIGFRALTSRKMQKIDKHIEKNRTHVHSVPLQAFVDFGYVGVVAWMLWFGLSFLSGVRTHREIVSCGEHLPAVAPVAMLASLFLFGFVEYNIADAAVVLTLSIVMGMCSMKFSGAARRLEV